MSLAKKSWKRVIALFLAVVMAISFAPNITSRAAAGASYKSAGQWQNPSESTGTRVLNGGMGDAADVLAFAKKMYGDNSLTYEDIQITSASTNLWYFGVEITEAMTSDNGWGIMFENATGDKGVVVGSNGALEPIGAGATGSVGFMEANMGNWFSTNAFSTWAGADAWTTASGKTAFTADELKALSVTVVKKPAKWTEAAGTISFATAQTWKVGETVVMDLGTGVGATPTVTNNELKQLKDSVGTLTNYYVDFSTGTGYQGSASDAAPKYKLAGSTVSEVTPMDGAKIYIKSGSDYFDVTSFFQNTNTSWNKTGGDNLTADEPGTYTVTLGATKNLMVKGASIIKGSTIDVTYVVEGDSTSRQNYRIDETSLIADYRVYADKENGGLDNDVYYQEVANEVSTTVKAGYAAAGLPVFDGTNSNANTLVVDNPIYYTVDEIKAKELSPVVRKTWYGKSDAISNDDVIYYYFKTAKVYTPGKYEWTETGSTGKDANATDEFNAWHKKLTDAGDLQGVLSAAGDGTLDSSLSAIKTTKPTEVGNYICVAVLKKTATEVAYVLPIVEFNITPVAITVIPDEGQTKVYGTEDKALTYKAFYTENLGTAYASASASAGYTYADWYAQYRSVKTYTAAIPDTATPYDAVSGNAYVCPKNAQAKFKAEADRIKALLDVDAAKYGATKIEPTAYEGIDETKQPILWRNRSDETGTEKTFDVVEGKEYGEKVGKYAIVVNDKDATDTSGVVGNYDITLGKDVTYAITAKPLTGLKVVYYIEDTDKNNDDPMKRTTSETYSMTYGKSYTPGLIVKDNIKVVKHAAAAWATTDLSSTGRVVYENKDIPVGYRAPSDANWVNGDGATIAYRDNGTKNYYTNLTVGGDETSSGSGDHEIKVKGRNDYSGELTSTWTIGTSGKTYDVTVYAGLKRTTSPYTVEASQANLLDNTDELEVTYTGDEYSIIVPVPTKYKTSATSDSYDLSSSEKPVVTYADLSDDYYTPGKVSGSDIVEAANYEEATKLIKHPTNDEKKYSTTIPKFKNVGTYKIGYKVTSNTGSITAATGTITITIKPAEFTYQVQPTTLEVGDPEYIVNAKANAANGAGVIEGKMKNEKGEFVAIHDATNKELCAWYSVNTGDLSSTRGVTLTAELIRDDENSTKLSDLVEASSKKAYENKIANGTKSYGITLTQSYLDKAAVNATLKAVNVTEITDAQDNARSWDDLTAEQKTALMAADIEAYTAKLFANKNYTMTPLAGAGTVTAAQYPIDVYVHESNAWNAAHSMWLDYDAYKVGHVPTLPDGVQYTAQNKSWDYGTYSAVGNLVEVYVDRTTRNGARTKTTIDGYYDDVDLLSKLPENVASTLSYRIYNVTGATVTYQGTDGTDNLDGTLGTSGTVAASELESTLDGLKTGDYKIEAVLGLGTAQSTTSYIAVKSKNAKVTKGTLKITEATGGEIAITDTFAGIKEEVGSVIVMVNGGVAPINESETTYALWYAKGSSYANETVAADGFTSADLPGSWKLAKDFKFDTVGNADVYVMAVPVSTMTNSLDKSNVKKVTIKVKAQPHGENDVVADLIMSHTGDEGGKTVLVAKEAQGINTRTDGSFTKTYGTYTSNKLKANGDLDMAADGSFTAVPGNENTKKFVSGIREYIIYELLSNNGYAVGKQNTELYWGKNANGQAALYRYADAKKIALLPEGFTANWYNASDDYQAVSIAADGAIINGYVDSAKWGGDPDNARVSYDYAASDKTITYDVLDGGSNAGKTNAQKLLEGIKISADVVSDENKIFSYSKSADGETPRVSIVGDDLQYVLAKNASGTADIKVTVTRSNFDEITFNITVAVDADAPVISVQSNDISKESSTGVVANTKFTDKYVNRAPEFTVTVEGAKEGGVYYYFESKEVYTEANVKDSTVITNLMWQPLEGDKVQTPAEDGTYILYVKAVDEAGNVSYASSKTAFTVDSKKPVIANSSDLTKVYTEELSSILLPTAEDKAYIKITDSSLAKVEAKLGDGEAVELTPNANMNYELTPNEETYTIIATDSADNIQTAKLDVNVKVDNTKNDITMTYAGEAIDLTTLADPADATKKLFTISANAGAATYSDATEEKNADGTYANEIAVRGAGTVEDGKLTVTKCGTFAIKLTTAKNGIYGETPLVAFLTVEKAERQVSIKLVDDPAATTKTAKTEFTKTEAANVGKYADLIFEKGGKTENSVVTYSFYEKGSETKLASAPEVVGDYEVSVAIAEDDLYKATDSLNAAENKKAEYKVVDYKKIKIDNEAAKGTVKVTDAAGAEIEDLNKVAKGTAVVVTVEAANGYKFTEWTAAGVTVADTKATKLELTVGDEDIELTANYAAGITIVTQPKSVKVYAEEKVTFFVEATGNGDNDLTYQWQVKTKDDQVFRPITGATSASYEIAAAKATDDGNQYNVIITSKSTGDVKTSETATLDVAGMSLEGAEITLENDSVVYNGSTQAPKIVKVVLAGTEITSNDYTVSTDTYIDAKEYTITITGAGDYTGTATAKYTIAPKPVTKDMFTAEDVNYTGEAVETTVTGKDGEKALVADKDFTVTYKNNTEVGTATAVVAGKGNYGDSVEIPFEVIGKSIKGATVSGLKTVAYTGKAITPAVTVKLDGKTLKKGTDYDVTYKNNTKVGTATVTITGKGDYSGTITKKFLIKKISFKYRAYVQKKNWMAWSTAKVSGTSASAMAGTTDNLRMETIQMQLSGVSGAIKYRAYVEKMGWTQWATTADTTTYAGTKGMARRVEMIQLQASGQVATLYDMYYRAYSEKFGWLGWAKSGEKAGSAGYARKLEAFQVNFVRKGESFTVKSDRTKCFYDKTKDGANPK